MSQSDQVKAAQQERERDRDHELAMAALQNGHGAQDPHSAYRDILEQLTQTDALPPGSKKLLKNLITPDWVLANLQKEDLWEIRFELRVIQEKFYSLHPSRESVMQGNFRAYVYDDTSERLTALSERQKLAADTFFRAIWLRVTRSRDFSQQKIIKTDISQREVQRPERESSDKGGLLGRFR